MSRLQLVWSAGEANADARPTALEAFQQELDYIVRSLRRLGVPPSEVEDIAHEVFLALRGTWHKYDPARPLRPYLYGIMFRVTAAYRRKRDREVVMLGLEVADPAPSTEEALDAARARTIVLTALQRIPLPRRAVLIRHEIDGVPVADVARELSIPLFTAYSRLRRARQQFHDAVRRILRP